MATAKAKSTTKDNPAIQRAGAALQKLIPVNARLEKERKRLYPKKELAAIDAKYNKFFNPFKGFPDDKARLRGAEYERVFRKRGYRKAADKSDRSDRELIKLSKRIIRMKARGLDDLAIQLIAFDCLRLIYCEPYTGTEFSPHFAKFCGVKLRATERGVR